MLTAETFLVMKEDKNTSDVQLIIKNIDTKMKNENMAVELENILGGGVIGNVANNILTMVGEDFLYAHKDRLSKTIEDQFQSKLDLLINV